MRRKGTRINNGYVYVLDPTTGTYRAKGSVEWEKAHPGEVVAGGEKVIFLDGDKTNFRANNLFKISNKIAMVVNRMHRKGDSIDIMRIIAHVAHMKIQANDMARKQDVYRQIAREDFKEYCRRMKAERPEQYKAMLQQKKDWARRHKDHIAAYGRAYRARHKAERQRQEAAHAD